MGQIKAKLKVYHIFYGEGTITKVSHKENEVWAHFWRIPNFVNDGIMPFKLSNVKKELPNWDTLQVQDRQRMTDQLFLEKFELDFKKG